MTWGPHEEKIIKACRETKQPLPSTILDAPRLPNSLQFYFHAFFDLNTCRGVGFSMGAIPWTAIHDYASRFEIVNLEDFKIFADLIRAMDKTYLDVMEKLKSKKK